MQTIQEKREYMKKYREANKDKMKEARDRYMNKPFICDGCAVELTYRLKKKHKCSKMKPDWFIFSEMTDQVELNIIRRNDVGLVTKNGKFYNIYLFV